MISKRALLACGVAFTGWLSFAAATPAQSADFAKDVYPIFQRACFECHSGKEQKGKLRLDIRESALKGGKDGPVILPGKSSQSELLRRITLPKGHDDVMPHRGEPLSKAETDRIKAWIDAGADWPESVKPAMHWAYVAPIHPKVPAGSSQHSVIRNPVDAFVFARLQNEGLTPSPEAPRETLIRRLSLDLIGLPPSPAEIDTFLNDKSPEAYEKLVNNLLASDQFGVRWARPWLDYARYADSHGFQRDDFRDLWPYRDWVVNSLNADMPFTEFTIEQLAGDLLPNATESQKIATGFNRSAPTNVEAGTDPEETRVNQIHDRINTLGMVWLGSTLECCQCHDHKYDPFTMKDYYGLFAFFNNTALEADRTNPKVPGSIQFKGPSMELADAGTQSERAKLQSELAAIKAKITALEETAAASQDVWESDVRKRYAEAPQEHVLKIESFESTGGATSEIQEDQSVLVSGEPAPDKDTYVIQARTTLTGIRGIKLEALTDDSLPGHGPGRGDALRPNFVLNNFKVTAAPAAKPEAEATVHFTKATASFSQGNFPVANLLKTDNDSRGGWAINPKFHESHWALLETATPLGAEGETILTFRLEQNYGAGRNIGRVRLSAVTGNVGAQALPSEIAKALGKPADNRTAKERKAVSAFRVKDLPEYAALEKNCTQLETQLGKIKAPTTLVMEELNQPRMSTIFQRGDFRNPGDAIKPHTPAVLHTLKSTANDSNLTRLDLAKWLVDSRNPLVARVTVNRWWAELFGHGLVTTPEDFGIKGDAPTHPGLLDWLATEFMDHGWSMKHILKTMVMSETYRQSSRASSQLMTLDDRNLLYARGPRFRMDAEMIRDNALAIAGLLDEGTSGPPIHPYQPDGLWVKVGGQKYDYVVSPGTGKYRRGLYVIWKRGAPYPSFVNFDANARLACRVKRPRSNTPLQALTLINDPVYVEAAMAFARRILSETPGRSVDERLDYAFRLATGRLSRPDEHQTLDALLSAELKARSGDATTAEDFVGKFNLPGGVTAEEFCAWYAVAAALLNLDETISKG